jgi:hypothetical protein
MRTSASDRLAAREIIIEITPVRIGARGQVWRTSLPNGDTVESRTPLFEAARALLRAGYDPAVPVASRHSGSTTKSMTSTVGKAAGLTVEENASNGPRIVPWVPYPGADRQNAEAHAAAAVERVDEREPTEGGPPHKARRTWTRPMTRDPLYRQRGWLGSSSWLFLVRHQMPRPGRARPLSAAAGERQTHLRAPPAVAPKDERQPGPRAFSSRQVPAPPQVPATTPDPP